MRRYQILAALFIIAAGGAPGAAEKATKVQAANPLATAAEKKAKEEAEYKGPTEADIRVAYTDKINAINSGTNLYLDAKAAAQLNIRLTKVDFVECEPFEDRTDLYLCSVLVESAVGDSSSEFKRVEIAMFKEKDAWRVK